MKIVHCVESYYPAVGGMQEVVKQLSERLVGFGHEVIVLTRFHENRDFKSLKGVSVEQFTIENNPKVAVTEEEKRYQSYLLNLEADVITFFAAQQWATDLALPLLPKIKAKKVSVPTGYSGLYKAEFKHYFEEMRKHILHYDMNVYLSNDYRDINFARENGVVKMTIIPNGAAADEFLPSTEIDVRADLKIPKNDFLILHVGSYTGDKGHREAVQMFYRSDIKKGTLLMIGNKYEYFKRQYIKHPLFGLTWVYHQFFTKKKIIFGFYSRAFTVAAYKQADLFLFPSNIECSPIVLFECAAASLPFLSSDAGNSKEISEWTGGGEVIPSTKNKDGYSHVNIDAGTKLLNELYHNSAKRNNMAQKAYHNWQEKFSWEVIAQSYEKLYQSLLK